MNGIMSGAAAHGHALGHRTPASTPDQRGENRIRKIYTVLVIENHDQYNGAGVLGRDHEETASGDHNQQDAGITRLRYCKARFSHATTATAAPPGVDRGNQLQQQLQHQQRQPRDEDARSVWPATTSTSAAGRHLAAGFPPASSPVAAAASASAAAATASFLPPGHITPASPARTQHSVGQGRHGSRPFVLPVRGSLVATYHFSGYKPPSFTERPQSFGLHSPDQLPQSESEFKAIASSFGLQSPENVAPSEKLHPSYNPRLFCDGGLYLDPDIIGESLSFLIQKHLILCVISIKIDLKTVIYEISYV